MDQFFPLENRNKKVGAGDPGQIREEAEAPPVPVNPGLPVRQKVYRMESDIFGTGMNPALGGGGRKSWPGAQMPEFGDRAGVGQAGRSVRGGGMVGRSRNSADNMEDPMMMVAAGKPTPSTNDNRNPVLGQGMTEECCDERFEVESGSTRRNARENGGNPLTGEGYAQEDKGFSQRRQYRHCKSTPLW